MVGAILAALHMLGGCAGQQADTYPTLTGRFAAEENFEPLVAEQALLGDANFEIVFSQGDSRYIGGGRLSVPRPNRNSDDRGAEPTLLPLEFWRPAERKLETGTGALAKVLGIQHW